MAWHHVGESHNSLTHLWLAHQWQSIVLAGASHPEQALVESVCQQPGCHGSALVERARAGLGQWGRQHLFATYTNTLVLVVR